MSVRKRQGARLMLSGILLLAVVGWLWWARASTSQANVFWGMLDNSLATTSVTRHVHQTSNGQSLDQYTRLLFGAQNASQTVETRGQDDGSTKSTIVQEILGTPSTDYSSFPKIQTNAKNAEGKPVDYSKIQSVWGKSSDAKPGQNPEVQNFNQAVLGTVPFANLSIPKRHELITYMKTNNVYSVDYAKTVQKKENGRSVYVYDVQINPKPYFIMLQRYVKSLGLGTIAALNPAQYEGVEPLSVQLSVVIHSRQLFKIHYSASGQDETYSSWGLTTPINLPTKTIPLSELQTRIEGIQ